jgi:hypothetical protein
MALRGCEMESPQQQCPVRECILEDLGKSQGLPQDCFSREHQLASNVYYLLVALLIIFGLKD